MRRIDKGLVEHFDEPAMNLCLYGFCASLESNICMAKIVAFFKKKKRKQYVNTNLLGLFYENASDQMNACGVSKSKMYASIISGN